MKTLYRASRVRTQTDPALADWMLVDGRHVERAGSGEPPDADRVVDLPGATIIPGFVDTHVHLTGTGIREGGLNLGDAASKAELLQRVREWEGEHEGRVLGQGFDETKWDDPSLPTLDELDAVARQPVILIRADGHISLANSAALEGSGVRDDDGVRLDDDGRVTGVLTERANERVQRWFFETLSDRELEEAQLQGAALAASRGITCVHEMSIPPKRGRRDFEVLMGHLVELPVYVVPYFGEFDIPYAIDFGVMRLGGDLFLDGSIGARTAALGEPYADGDGTGTLYVDDDDLAEAFHNAHLAGAQVGVHAIGDMAIEQAVRVWERVYRSLDSRERRHFRARRHRVEHFEMPTRTHIERAATLGLAISAQPAFDAEWGAEGQLYERRLGVERAARMNPFRTLIERGLQLGCGSDAPVTPLDPTYAVWALEAHHDASQRLTRSQAIRACTIGSARLAHLEDKKGVLQPGAHADFAAYEDDPFEADAILGLQPVLTVSQGREVYAR